MGSGSDDQAARRAAGPHRPARRHHRRLQAVHHRRSAGCSRCAAIVLSRTRFGSRLRAAVDDPRVARGLGINVNLVFAVTFAVGSGLAGLGGALGADVLGMDPTFPLKFMIYFLIVVTVGGTSSITGAFLASLLLGVADIAGKYYVPKIGAFIIYAIMVLVLIWRPQGLFARSAAPMSEPASKPRSGAAAVRRRPALAAAAPRWRRGRSPSGSWPSRPFPVAAPVAAAQRDRDPRPCSRSRWISSWAMPASSRWAMRRSSASAPIRLGCSRNSAMAIRCSAWRRGRRGGACSASRRASCCCAAPT